MDWVAISHVLGDRNALPVVAVDRKGLVRFLNHAMEQVLGWNRFDADGTPWSELFEGDGDGWLIRAMRGTLRRYEVVSRPRRGGSVLFDFEVSFVGRRDEEALLLVAERVTPLRSRSIDRRNFSYDLSTRSHEWGRLLRVCSDGETVPIEGAPARCHEFLFERDAPCTDCPLRGGREGAWPSRRVRREEASGRRGSGYEVTSATPVGDSVVRVRVHWVSEDTLAEIHRVQVRHIAHDAGLSTREADVLEHLLAGRATEDIATLLHITPRTVKYHQSNVLRKVGAESRIDLLRLVF